MLHGLLQGINSPRSFKFSVMGFNPSLTSGFSGYCFLCGNKCGSLSVNYRNRILCSTHRFSISPYSRIYIFFSIKGRLSEDSKFMKTESFKAWTKAWTLFTTSLSKRGEGDSGTIRNSCENSTE